MQDCVKMIRNKFIADANKFWSNNTDIAGEIEADHVIVGIESDQIEASIMCLVCNTYLSVGVTDRKTKNARGVATNYYRHVISKHLDKNSVFTKKDKKRKTIPHSVESMVEND